MTHRHRYSGIHVTDTLTDSKWKLGKKDGKTNSESKGRKLQPPTWWTIIRICALSPVLQHSRLIQHLLFVPSFHSVDALQIQRPPGLLQTHTLPILSSHFWVRDTTPDCPGEYLVNMSLVFSWCLCFYQAWELERCPVPPSCFVLFGGLFCFVMLGGGLLLVCLGSLWRWQPSCMLIRFSFCLSIYHFTWNPLSWCGEHAFFYFYKKNHFYYFL